jgi:hypothetical protein
MTPGKYDLCLYRGDSKGWQFRLWADPYASVAVDLTGATVAAEIREKSAGTHIVALDTNVTLPNMIDVTITPDMYTDCPAKGVWDLQITFAGGVVNTPVYGTVTVTADVTDSAIMPTVGARR